MSDGYQQFNAVGNLTRDGELRTTSGGQAVLKFSIAVGETYLDRNRQKQQKTEFVNCVVWGKQAETLSQYLVKGKQVMVVGKLQSSSYDDKDGNKKYRTEINCLRVMLLGGFPRGDSAGAPASAPAKTAGGGFDDGQYGDPPDGASADDDFPF